jgi:hypothetical protein
VSTALALVLALGLGAADDPYIRSRVNTGIPNDPKSHCLWWDRQDPNDRSHFLPLVFHSSQAGNPETPGDTEFSAAGKALATWNEASAACGHLTIQEGPRVADRSIGFDPKSANNENIIVYRQQFCSSVAPGSDSCWSDSSCQNKFDCWEEDRGTIALTTTSFNNKTGEILDADIEMNAAGFVFTTVDSPPCVASNLSQSCVATDVQNTLTHELGHTLGLDHTQNPGSVMNPKANIGETSKRTLDPGTSSFICDVYPRGLPARDCVVESVSMELGEQAPSCSGAGAAPASLALGLWAMIRLRRKGRARQG